MATAAIATAAVTLEVASSGVAPGGPGNPLNAHVNRLRVALLRAVTPADLKAVVRKLVKLAKGGDVAACKELLDRCLGKSVAPVELAGDLNITHDVDLAAIRDGFFHNPDYLSYCRSQAWRPMPRGGEDA